MDKTTHSFEDWFSLLQMNVEDECGAGITPEEVRDDYDNGRDLFDVKDEIVVEYQ